MIFLSVGEKIKKCRKLYKIKQTAFEKYGITQNYLSLIENDKRVPSLDVLTAIYDGFMIITDSDIKNEYSESQFVQSESDQAKAWLVEQLEADDFIKNFEELISVSKKYQINDVCFDIYYKLGIYYKDNREYQKSNEYLQEAIYYALADKKPVADLYKFMGSSLKLCLNYEGALACYVTGLTHAKSEGNETLYYRIKCNMGTVLFKLERFESAIECANEAIDFCTDETVYGIAVLLKANILRQLERFEEAEFVLTEFISKTSLELYMIYAEYNLACVYSAAKQFEKGLEVSFNLLHDDKVDVDTKKKAMTLIAYMYFCQDKYSEANEFLKQIREKLDNYDDDHRFTEWYYNVSIDVYIALDYECEVTNLFNDLKNMLEHRRITNDYFNQMQNRVFRYIIENNKLESYNKLNLT